MPGAMPVENARRILDEINALPIEEQQAILRILTKKLGCAPPDDAARKAAAEEIAERHRGPWKELAER